MMLDWVEKLKKQINDVKEDLAGMLIKIDFITSAINDKYVFSKRIGVPENKDDDACGLLMLIQDTRNLQRELAFLQARLANYLDKLEINIIKGCNSRTSLEIIPNGIRIVVLDEFPPKTSVYDRITLKNGILTNYAYAEARNRWYSLIKQAVAEYTGERIAPAIIYIKYYVPKICDAGNFLSKFIIDGLMYNGAIAIDDNLDNVNAVIQEAVLDQHNPRTEIYVFKNIGQLDTIFTNMNN